MDGAVLEAGDELTEGSVNPHDILKIKGVRAVQDYMLREVQRVYRLQGVEINDKHIEVIVRQMLQKIRVEENGDSDLLPGSMVDSLDFLELNEKLEEEGKEQAVVSAIHRLAKPDSVELESNIALIAVVGRGMRSTRGTSGRIFSALAHANVNVKMIDQGSSELNIIIGVSNSDFENAIKAIYDIFVTTQL